MKNKADSMDNYFLLTDERIQVPDVTVRDLSEGQTRHELRGFPHLRAVQNADGTYAGIQLVSKEA